MPEGVPIPENELTGESAQPASTPSDQDSQGELFDPSQVPAPRHAADIAKMRAALNPTSPGTIPPESNLDADTPPKNSGQNT